MIDLSTTEHWPATVEIKFEKKEVTYAKNLTEESIFFIMNKRNAY